MVQIKVTGTKKTDFLNIFSIFTKNYEFLGPVTSFLTFYIFLQNAPEYVNHSGNLVF